MGSSFIISVVSNDSIQADEQINIAIKEIERIESVISSWDSKTETALINKNAGEKPTKVSAELFNLIERCIAISKLTDGAFDISYASMDQLWKFDGSMKMLPTEDDIKKSVSKIGYKNILLDKSTFTVLLKLKGMKIGFGAIGKGYAADKAKELLVKNGVKSGIINASGDINAWGKQPNGKEWTIGIVNPLNKTKVFATLPINNQAVVTSGNYEKFVTFSGKRYSHIIDPRSGYPTTGIVSVSIFSNIAELADALATSVFIMGKEVGLDRINQMPNVECIIINEKGKVFTSKNIQIENL